MAACKQKYTENPHTQINISSGTATIPYQTSTVWSAHYCIEPKDICSSKQSLEEEHKLIQEALQTCKYLAWAINRMKIKTNSPRNRNNNKPDNRPMHRNSVTVPYNEGLSETFKNICKRYGIQVHYKSGKTIKEELVAPKDQDHITKKSGIYLQIPMWQVGMWSWIHWRDS